MSSSAILYSSFYLFVPEKTIMCLPIPAKGPKVTSLIWNGLDDLIVTGHDNGDIVQVFKVFHMIYSIYFLD